MPPTAERGLTICATYRILHIDTQKRKHTVSSEKRVSSLGVIPCFPPAPSPCFSPLEQSWLGCLPAASELAHTTGRSPSLNSHNQMLILVIEWGEK